MDPALAGREDPFVALQDLEEVQQMLETGVRPRQRRTGPAGPGPGPATPFGDPFAERELNPDEIRDLQDERDTLVKGLRSFRDQVASLLDRTRQRNIKIDRKILDDASVLVKRINTLLGD